MTGSAAVTPVAPRLQPDRYLVPDVARGLAILAMLIAHAGPLMVDQPAATAFLQGQLNDVASPLFAAVMGSATAIVLAKAGSERGAAGTVIGQNLIRGAILVLLGVFLSAWGSWIAVILSFLGIVLAVGTPLLLLGTRALIAVLAVLLVVGAPLNELVLSIAGPVIPGQATPGGLLLEWLFLSPHYRVTNLLPWFLFGALLFRRGFGGRRTGWVLLAVAVPAWWARPIWQSVSGAESSPSGSYLDTLHDAGLVLGTLGVIILLATVTAPGPARVVRAVFLPFRAIGSVSLSLYVFQVGVVAWMAAGGSIQYGTTDPVAWTVLVVGVPIVGVLWWRFVGKGPIELLIGLVSGRYALRPGGRLTGTGRKDRA